MSLVRVNYRERQRLRAADLQVDQDYHRSAEQRHATGGPHRAGTVTGLQLEIGVDAITGAPSLTLQPGAATDDAGHLLVVGEAIDLTAAVARVTTDADADVDAGVGPWQVRVWLWYEERPATTGKRPRGECGPGRHARIVEDVRIAVSVGDAPPALAPEALLVVGADVAADGALTIDAGVEAALAPTTVLASYVTSPRGDVRLAIGPRGQGDGNHFAISVKDDAGAWIDRLAVGRDGLTHVVGALDVIAQSADPNDPNAAPPCGSHGGLTLDTPLTADEEPELSYCDAPEPERMRALAVRARSRCANPAAILFQRSAAPVPSEPPWRTTFVQLPDDQGGGEQVRIELDAPGEKGESRTRFEVGMHGDSTEEFVRGLSLSAGKKLIVHGSRDPDGRGQAALAVAGRITQQPLPADGSNPLFKQLLVLASINGFISVAAKSQDFSLELQNLPPRVPARQPWSYTVSARITGGAGRLLWLIETPNPGSGAVPAPIFLQNQVVGGGGFPILVVRERGWHEPGTLRLAIAVTARRGQVAMFQNVATGAGGANPVVDDVIVVDPPELDLSDLPFVVLPDVAWTATFAAENMTGTDIELQRLEAAVSAADEEPTNWQALFVGSETLAADDTKAFPNPVNVPAAADGDELKVSVRLRYQFDGQAGDSWHATAHHIVDVRRHLRHDVDGLPDSIDEGAAWGYELTVENATAWPITDLVVQQTMRDQNDVVMGTANEEVLAAATLETLAEARETVSNAAPPQGATEARLTLTFAYEQDGRAWTYDVSFPPIPIVPVDIT